MKMKSKNEVLSEMFQSAQLACLGWQRILQGTKKLGRAEELSIFWIVAGNSSQKPVTEVSADQILFQTTLRKAQNLNFIFI